MSLISAMRRDREGKEAPRRERIHPGSIVPPGKPNLLVDDPIQLVTSRRPFPGKFESVYERRRRHAALDRSVKKLVSHGRGMMSLSSKSPPRDGTMLDMDMTGTLRLDHTQTIGSQTVGTEYFMAPDHFQDPAGGVMTHKFENELQRRIEQANPPEEAWLGLWPRTLLCERCQEFCSAVEGGCACCDLVVHFACMTSAERGDLRDGEYMCDVCSKFKDENNAQFTFWKDKLRRLRHEKQSVKKVVDILKRNFFRRKYLRIRRATVLLQRAIRRFLFWRRIRKFRRSIVRPVKVSILSVEGIAPPFRTKTGHVGYYPNPFVIMTVMDLFGHMQRFKFKGKELSHCLKGEFNDEFLIPGSSAQVLLVFTLVHKRRSEESIPRDVFLGQAVLTLQSVVANAIAGKECTLELGDIEHVPMESPYSEVKMDALDNYRSSGILRINIRPFPSIVGQVATVYGPSLDVWKRRATHISGLDVGGDMGRKSKWYLVLAEMRVYVFKKEGLTEPKVAMDAREIMTMQFMPDSMSMVLVLNDRTRIPLTFGTYRELCDWWFAFMLCVAVHKGMSLQHFVSKIVPRVDYWAQGALVAAAVIAAIEKRSARVANIPMAALPGASSEPGARLATSRRGTGTPTPREGSPTAYNLKSS